MATRTKVDALAELGEKVTGKTIAKEENETIVGIIDKITSDYEGGGGENSKNYIKLKTIPEGEGFVTITDTEDLAMLDELEEKINNDEELPNFYVEEIKEFEEEQLVYKAQETYNCIITNENGAIKVEAYMIYPAYNIEPDFSITNNSSLAVVVITKSNDEWQYARGIKPFKEMTE